MSEPATIVVLESFRATRPSEHRIVANYQEVFFDSFMDALGYYIEWRAKTKSTRGFLNRLLKKWGVSQWIPEYPESTVRNLVKRSLQSLVINDDATISIALSEYVVEGRVGRGVRKKALVCLRRQMTSLVVSRRRYDDPEKVLVVLEDVKALLSGP